MIQVEFLNLREFREAGIIQVLLIIEICPETGFQKQFVVQGPAVSNRSIEYRSGSAYISELVR